MVRTIEQHTNTICPINFDNSLVEHVTGKTHLRQGGWAILLGRKHNLA